MSIFVVAIDNGYEGHTAPIQAFSDRETALAAVQMSTWGGSACAEVYEVPMWPEVRKGQYWEIKPVGAEA